MIGFNTKVFAGKTDREKEEEAEAIRLERIREKYEYDFAVWAEEFEQHIKDTAKANAKTAANIRSFAYLNAEWFYYVVGVFTLLCLIFGWCCHDLYISATGDNLTMAIGSIIYRFIFGSYMHTN